MSTDLKTNVNFSERVGEYRRYKTLSLVCHQIRNAFYVPKRTSRTAEGPRMHDTVSHIKVLIRFQARNTYFCKYFRVFLK